MKDNDKRKFFRFNAFLEGTFQAEDHINGLIMLTEMSKVGFRIALNQHVNPGKWISLEIQFPGSIVPIFAKGIIMWIKKSSKDWTYAYEAGVRLEQIDPLDRHRILDFAYENWRKLKGKA